MDTIKDLKKRVINNTLKIVIIFVIAFVLIYLISTYFILKAIGILLVSTTQIKNKNYDIHVDINSRDEIEELGNNFNDMTREIKSHISHIENLNKSYYKFVPEEFLSILNKDISGITLGDKVLSNITILFSDIRNFTAMSEKLTPEENFTFINEYLDIMGPVIRHNHGFIDKYIGDGIMALFPQNPTDSIEASIQMIKKLNEYNNTRVRNNYMPIDIGIGINFGMSMLGVIGEKKRYECSVISDSVNTASRIEGITKVFGVQLIIGESVLNAAQDNMFHYRFLGEIKVKGKEEMIKIYEVFDGDNNGVLLKKKETLIRYNAAIDLYVNSQYKEALLIFEEINKYNPDDRPVHFFIQKCKEENIKIFY